MSHRESGVSSLEWLGVMLVAGCVIASIAFTVSAERAGEQTRRALCGITGNQGCGSGPGGTTGRGPSGATTCDASPIGAAGPTRGSVSVPGSQSTGLSVSVQGDGTYLVSRTGDNVTTGTSTGSWAAEHLTPAAVQGLEPFLRGGGDAVYTADSSAALADLLADDRRQSWKDSLFGEDGPAPARALSATASSLLDVLGGGTGLPDAGGVFTDTSVAAGLSTNAYDQVLSLDAGGEALGTLRLQDGSTTDYVGVTPATAEGAADLAPVIVATSRNAAGAVTAVRLASDRDLAATTPTVASEDLYVSQLDVAPGSHPTVLADLASSLGVAQIGDTAATTSGSAPVSFTTSASDFTNAAVRSGHADRQRPSGTVTTSDPNTDPLTAGLASVLRSSVPQSWNGVAWTDRPSGCGR